MSESRTKNTAKNFTISFIIQVIALVVTFINRTFFIQFLNTDYLGVNGLFTNILTILSFAELGLGSAILYSMYKPVKEGDHHKISALFNLYKKAYRIIAIVIFLVGLLVIPFLPWIIKEEPNIVEDLRIIYVLFLGNTACSYILSYSKSLFTVYQKEYVNVLIERSAHIVCVIVQLLFLWLTHNYIGYLLIQIVFTLLGNVVINQYSKRKYSVIVADKTATLEKKDVSIVFANIRSILFYKIGSVILNATDNLIITQILGVTIVGVCSNYTLLIGTVEALLFKALSSIVASIGNMNASKSVETKRKVFKELNFCVYWMYGFCSIELAIMLNKAITVWLGSKYVIDNSWTVLALVLNFYIFGTNFAPSNFRVTMGFFKEARNTPVIASVINIALSFILGYQVGLFGIFIATSIARVFTFGIVDPITVSKKGLNCSPKGFYIKEILSFIITVGNGIICYIVVKYIKIQGILGFLIEGFVVAILANLIYLLVYFRTKEFRDVWARLKRVRARSSQ